MGALSTLARRAGAAALVLAATALAGCASLPAPGPRPASQAVVEVADTPLARIASTDAPADASQRGLSGFRLLPEAAFALEARLALVQAATRTLDVQYYLLAADDVGLQLLRALRDAAGRGVRVRLLVDDFYTAGEDELLASFAALPNVEVRLFNPFALRIGSPTWRLLLSMHEFSRINHRMHNKQLLADNSFAVTGGRNIANEYFMRSAQANFIDVDVLSSGPVVRAMSAGFDRYWNSPQVRPIGDLVAPPPTLEAARSRFEALSARPDPDAGLRDRDVLGRTPVGAQLAAGRVERIWGHGRVFTDDPAKITRQGLAAYEGSVTQGALEAFNSARDGVAIASPYFIPGDRGVQMMETAIARGGKVTLLTNSLGSTDEPLAYAGYARYRNALLRAGVRIHEIGDTLSGRSGRYGEFGHSVARLHAKLAVIDDERFFIGSMNLDHRSAELNTETGLLIDSRELVADYRRLFPHGGPDGVYDLRLNPRNGEAQWVERDPDGAEVLHDAEPGSTPWLRLKNWLILPLVGEQML